MHIYMHIYICIYICIYIYIYIYICKITMSITASVLVACTYVHGDGVDKVGSFLPRRHQVGPMLVI